MGKTHNFPLNQSIDSNDLRGRTNHQRHLSAGDAGQAPMLLEIPFTDKALPAANGEVIFVYFSSNQNVEVRLLDMAVCQNLVPL